MNTYCRNQDQQTAFGVSKLQAFTLPLFNTIISVDLLPSISDYVQRTVSPIKKGCCHPWYLVFIPGTASTLQGASGEILILWAGRQTGDGAGAFHAQHKYGVGAAIAAWSISQAKGISKKRLRTCFHLLLACFLRCFPVLFGCSPLPLVLSPKLPFSRE